MVSGYALAPDQLLRSIDASRDSLGRSRMRLIDLVTHVEELTCHAAYAVVGGLAQILWARKTHTDDLDLVVAAADLSGAWQRIQTGLAPERWSLPAPPDEPHEADAVFEVCHLSCDGAVVDLIAFRDAAFNAEIIRTATQVSELSGLRFVRPELLLVTHLLRPGPQAAVAAVELILARRAHGGLDLAETRRWAARLGRAERLERVEQLAETFSLA